MQIASLYGSQHSRQLHPLAYFTFHHYDDVKQRISTHRNIMR